MISEERRVVSLYRPPQCLKKYICGRVLDVGAGNAGLLMNGYPDSYVLFDISQPAVDNVNDLDHPDATGVLGDATKVWPFPDESFDTVWASHIIEHLSVDQVRYFMKEAHRVLKKGGCVVVVTPSSANWFFYSEWTHVRPYDWKSLSDLLLDNGFSVIEWVYPRAYILPKIVQRHASKLPLHTIVQEVAAVGVKQ